MKYSFNQSIAKEFKIPVYIDIVNKLEASEYIIDMNN